MKGVFSNWHYREKALNPFILFPFTVVSLFQVFHVDFFKHGPVSISVIAMDDYNAVSLLEERARTLRKFGKIGRKPEGEKNEPILVNGSFLKTRAVPAVNFLAAGTKGGRRAVFPYI